MRNWPAGEKRLLAALRDAVSVQAGRDQHLLSCPTAVQ